MASAGRRYCDPLDDHLPGMAKGLPLIFIGYWEYVPAGDPVGLWEYDFGGDDLDA
ncbi:MAG: hypothetical protein ACLQFR_27325 [Streptosporangiaceae bacterium]